MNRRNLFFISALVMLGSFSNALDKIKGIENVVSSFGVK